MSTDSEEQLTSYKAQGDYYTNFIKNRDDWDFIDIYTDEGISATNTKHHDGFKQIIADALEEKIDLIITKSVSKFARNTVDSLTTVKRKYIIKDGWHNNRAISMISLLLFNLFYMLFELVHPKASLDPVCLGWS